MSGKNGLGTVMVILPYLVIIGLLVYFAMTKGYEIPIGNDDEFDCSRVPIQHGYETKEQALEVADQLGISGFHIHEYGKVYLGVDDEGIPEWLNLSIVYMPGNTMQEFEDAWVKRC